MGFEPVYKVAPAKCIDILMVLQSIINRRIIFNINKVYDAIKECVIFLINIFNKEN